MYVHHNVTVKIFVGFFCLHLAFLCPQKKVGFQFALNQRRTINIKFRLQILSIVKKKTFDGCKKQLRDNDESSGT